MRQLRKSRLTAVGAGAILFIGLLAGPTACTQSPAESAPTNSNRAETPGPVLPDNAANAVNLVTPEDVAAPLPPPKPAVPEDLSASNDTAEIKPFPRQVTDFMVARDSCDHFRGEEGYDADRRAYLEQNIRALCTGTDERLAALRKRYADDTDVISALAGYGDRIEVPAEN